MARHSLPLEVQKLKGADKKHPDRYRRKVPKSDLPLGEAPEHMRDDAAACWFELSTYALPGVLTGADRILLEVTAELLSEYRSNPTEFAVGKYTHLIGCLARFGMSPSDRNKLGVADGKQENEFANLDD